MIILMMINPYLIRNLNIRISKLLKLELQSKDFVPIGLPSLTSSFAPGFYK